MSRTQGFMQDLPGDGCEQVLRLQDLPCKQVSTLDCIPGEQALKIEDLPCGKDSRMEDIPSEQVSWLVDLPRD